MRAITVYVDVNRGTFVTTGGQDLSRNAMTMFNRETVEVNFHLRTFTNNVVANYPLTGTEEFTMSVDSDFADNLLAFAPKTSCSIINASTGHVRCEIDLNTVEMVAALGSLPTLLCYVELEQDNGTVWSVLGQSQQFIFNSYLQAGAPSALNPLYSTTAEADARYYAPANSNYVIVAVNGVMTFCLRYENGDICPVLPILDGGNRTIGIGEPV